MRWFLVFVLCALITFSCKDSKRPQTALDAARTFIRASLDGDFDKAEPLLLRDSTNLQMFSSYKEYYDRLPVEVKKKYKESEYNINAIRELADTAAIVNYSNSFMNKPMEIKVVQANKDWQIDFKHTSAN